MWLDGLLYKKKKEIKVVDLFCGIGGLSNGFYQEGFNVIAGYDTDMSCTMPMKQITMHKY